MLRFLPPKEGLYCPRFEHDACGVGFVAHAKGKKSHSIVQKGIQLLLNLEHRGAVGAEPNSGDGAGILIQLPHEFFLEISSELGFQVPEFGQYAVGQVFLPPQKNLQEQCKTLFEDCVKECGQKVLGWRSVPKDSGDLGQMVLDTEPAMFQVFIQRDASCIDDMDFERKLFVIRKYVRAQVLKKLEGAKKYYYVGSLSYKTIVYKGQLITNQLSGFFDDLSHPKMASALALVHSRFSTNTFPSWPLAQPFRYLAHNGEINTVGGNMNWMKARENLFKSAKFSDEELSKICPIIDEDGSDSSVLDNAVEFLTLSGRSLPHVMMMLIPQAWEKNKEIHPDIRAFYEFHSSFMEPWDGPSSVAFTDGCCIGAILDRNGLRPSRYSLDKDDVFVMASEQGALDVFPEDVVLKGRVRPGQMFLLDLNKGEMCLDDETIKLSVSRDVPYGDLVEARQKKIADLPSSKPVSESEFTGLLEKQQCFGYTLEDLNILMRPMMATGMEAIGSMGNDTPVAVLSNRSVNLFNYFHQLFAQVTNPPIDPIREESVMSLRTLLGAQGNILDFSYDDKKQTEPLFIELASPVVSVEDLEKLKSLETSTLSTKVLSILFDLNTGSLEESLERICSQVVKEVEAGHSIIVLSDKEVSSSQAPIPSLLATAAVHHRLIEKGLRTECSLVVETGEAREVHHFAVLIGYGANAICPYLAFECVSDMKERRYLDVALDQKDAEANYIRAVNKGLLKIISKMGISTIQSYRGAQIFEAIGLGEDLVDRYFCGTPSRIGGIGLVEIQKETLIRHSSAYPEAHLSLNSNDESKVSDKILGDRSSLETGGYYHWRQRGEAHIFSPEVVHTLQRSVRQNSYDTYKKFTTLIDDQKESFLTLRGLLDFKETESIPLEEVESVESICRRFATGAMSYGSISKEAHMALAVAMNRIGAKSNTGEGGEDPERFSVFENGDNACSAIKQVASGRFGVTSDYLVHSEEIQIKIAQGAKPGEGGQLPGHKVDEAIAKVRHSTPGVGLISPPPHHDIYSIEDLAQLIFDLKNANDEARVSVKLVSEVGVGTIAVGVTKAYSDVVLIAGYDGGTGASPQTSIKHAGLPWELGLAETHQTLVKNRLRNRVVLQADGQMRTGRDLAIATLLGAEEWGVATAGLVALGCILMRKCHLNTCPVGIATQDKDLRNLYHGEVDHVVNYFRFMAQDLRETMAKLGFRTVNEMVGRSDKLKSRDNIKHWKAKTLNLESLLYKMSECEDGKAYAFEKQANVLEDAFDYKLFEKSSDAIRSQKPFRDDVQLKNTQRTFGAILSSKVTKIYGAKGLPQDTLHFKCKGTGGQSFGAFTVPGVTLEMEGDANDYFGKGMCGGRLILYPPQKSSFVSNENVIVGNVAFYGATSGESFINGLAGERFCVRNSGVSVVVESIGDHGCEYMTGGRVVVLGEIGHNFAAGMSGGIAYIFDEKGVLASRINTGIVDLDPLETDEDLDEVSTLIRKHVDHTKSQKGQEILDDWENCRHKFIKVMPQDYKRVLRENQK
ncbi:glutamate synthase subunit alpha [PVC group bacterium (ex Bugula neritina AB1)]|nr:glutamate synthase subunit alpha [PVC group bacterium (ex Bugula neritina AB1)]